MWLSIEKILCEMEIICFSFEIVGVSCMDSFFDMSDFIEVGDLLCGDRAYVTYIVVEWEVYVLICSELC